MKLKVDILKHLARVISLLIFFVLLFLLTCFLYSMRYWPDVYNYINANITITHIPTLRELNITVIRVEDYGFTNDDFTVNEEGFTTESYYIDGTTDVFDDKDNVDAFDYFFNERKTRSIQIKFDKDYSEVPTQVVVDYKFEDDAVEDLSDLALGNTNHLMKSFLIDQTLITGDMEDVEMVNGTFDVTGETHLETGASLSESIFPWIATIFVKNGSNNQFDYFCDGAILSKNTVLTSGRCVSSAKSSRAEDFIIIVGKRSLQTTGESEMVHRVKQIILQDNFTTSANATINDLAVLVLDDDLVFNNGTRATCIFESNEEAQNAFTTGWDYSGNLTAIRLQKDLNCKDIPQNTFCTAFGNNVAVCPSHGGVHATKQSDGQFCLSGVRTSDTTARGVCIDRNVIYTDIKLFKEWTERVVNDNKGF